MFISTLTITPLIVIVHLHMKKNPPSTVAIAIHMIILKSWWVLTDNLPGGIPPVRLLIRVHQDLKIISPRIQNDSTNR